ncbi:MAG: ribonuclease H-like domain-containing protein [Candidatus Krumholzibacteria bacterium]|nr:ribonuclease H-like domain-containing protein [Candidatus Krumholzibacteria bacterium]
MWKPQVGPYPGVIEMIRYRSDLRREIEALKKRAEGIFMRRGPDRVKRPSGAIEDVIPGVQVESGGGVFYRVLAGADKIWEDAETFHGEYLEALSDPFAPGTSKFEPLKILRDVPIEEICYLDLETTGLSMVPLFLVGLMYTTERKLVVDQLFARDYTEEPVVLRFLKGILRRFKAVVTFNGITFDLPFLSERMAVAGIEFSPPEIHLDLLPLARRALKGRTPNHRLQTLEIYLCNRKRIGDVPGSEIPDVYHEFVRTGDAGDIEGVFHHNRLDLLTMIQLVTVFLSGRC